MGEGKWPQNRTQFTPPRNCLGCFERFLGSSRCLSPWPQHFRASDRCTRSLRRVYRRYVRDPWLHPRPDELQLQSSKDIVTCTKAQVNTCSAQKKPVKFCQFLSGLEARLRTPKERALACVMNGTQRCNDFTYKEFGHVLDRALHTSE